MRDDVWMPHELVFVLDIYLKHGDLRRSDPLVVEASRLLRLIGLAEGIRPDNFRSPSSVASKLANFRSLDTRTPGGRPNRGVNDVLIWEGFHESAATVEIIAGGVRLLAARLETGA